MEAKYNRRSCRCNVICCRWCQLLSFGNKSAKDVRAVSSGFEWFLWKFKRLTCTSCILYHCQQLFVMQLSAVVSMCNYRFITWTILLNALIFSIELETIMGGQWKILINSIPVVPVLIYIFPLQYSYNTLWLVWCVSVV